MAPQPKRRHSRGKGRVRLKTKGLHITNLSPCPSCKKHIRPHRVCPFCGYYKGLAVIVKREKSKRKPKEDEDSK